MKSGWGSKKRRGAKVFHLDVAPFGHKGLDLSRDVDFFREVNNIVLPFGKTFPLLCTHILEH